LIYFWCQDFWQHASCSYAADDFITTPYNLFLTNWSWNRFHRTYAIASPHLTSPDVYACNSTWEAKRAYRYWECGNSVLLQTQSVAIFICPTAWWIEIH